MSVEIRMEEAGDVLGIRETTRRAFGREVEARLVDDLRDGGHLKLSLVAEREGRLVGHVMLSGAVIRTERGEVEALALGPVSVLPEDQGRGVGSDLIIEALALCAHAGHRIVVLLGHPGYYPRFGFSAERAGNLSSAYAGEAFMALELVPGALSGVVGRFEFAPPFGTVS